MPTLAALALLFITVIVPLDHADAAGASLRVLWSKPISAEHHAGGFILSDRIRSSDGSIAFFATGGLMTAPEENGPGPVIPWNNKNRIILTIAQDKENTYWLGGRNNQRSYVPGGDISDAYLARINSQGQMIDEYAYKSWFSFRQIQDLLPLDTGEVVVAENDRLAKISNKGRVLWEKKFNPIPIKKIALSQIGHRIIVATIEKDMVRGEEQYRDNVVVRILGTDGKTYAEHVIRTGINVEQISHYGNLKITKSDDAVYVSSSWADLFNAQPIEISKISNDGSVIWQKKLASSISHNPNRTWGSCKQEHILLADGRLLVACVVKGEIFLYQINSDTGDMKVDSVALPECHKNGHASLFLSQRKNGAIWLFGSRPNNNVAASCTWLGELKLD